MIDTAKIADLVLMTVDASYGFEMETFEFLSILQTHGFPRIMGVLTHLDSPKFKTKNNGAKKLRQTKKRLKHRFWTEIYQGAKLFYLSGLINGKYPKNEILNLSRFISVMKFRPLAWRNTHPYMLADRMEDLTPPEMIFESDKTCDRTISLYGYIRGTNLREKIRAHIPGVGDLTLSTCSLLPDPCPAPGATDKSVKRRLDDRQKLLYAPMSDVSGILYDKDAVYISVPGAYTKKDSEGDEHEQHEKTEGEKMIVDLQDTSQTLDEQISNHAIRIFSKSAPVHGKDAQKDILSDDEGLYPMELRETDEQGRTRRRAMLKNENENEDSELSDDENNSDYDEGAPIYDDVVSDTEEQAMYANSDSDLGEISDQMLSEGEDDEEEEGESKWKNDLAFKAAERFLKGKKASLMDVIYGQNQTSSDINRTGESKDGFLRLKEKKDKMMDESDEDEQIDIDDEKLMSKFVDHGANDAEKETDDDNEGDFEDLENPESAVVKEISKEEQLKKKKEELKRRFDAEYDHEDDEEAGEKLNMYEQAKVDMEKRTAANQEAFEDMNIEARGTIEGYRPGQYVRILVHNVPAEFVENFNPDFPIVVGGLLMTEEKFGFIQARVKKHRWHKKILKNNDPLIFSLGWRRFQSIPIYSLNDGTRNRMLKYTPEHMHCLATFFGPLASPNVGFCCVQKVNEVTVCI